MAEASIVESGRLGNQALSLLGWLSLALFLAGWLHVAMTVILPALWGPYAFAFLDAGPLMASRGGTMFVFVALPFIALTVPLARARSLAHWAVLQVGALVLTAAALLAQGQYIHSVVNLQGVPASLEALAAEVGFKSADAVPEHIKEAFKLSDQLAKDGKSPWLPGAWKAVAWPEIPARKMAGAVAAQGGDEKALP